MSSLSDQIDRLTRSTRVIRSTATSIASSTGNCSVYNAGPFSRAVLHAHLSDLIRDIDTSELGLFQLVNPPISSVYDKDVRATGEPEVQRIEFSGATPLRKGLQRRNDTVKQDIDPEVYAQAALKYIDRYQPIRPMPRAQTQVEDILERLDAVHANIASLGNILQQSQPSSEQSVKLRLEQEETRIRDLQVKISEFNKRKLAVMAQTQTPAKTQLKTNPQAKASPPPSTSEEDQFWNTPAASRTLRFSDDLLMDEQMDVGDVTATFTSPIASTHPKQHRTLLSPSPFGKEAKLSTSDPFEHRPVPPEVLSSKNDDRESSITFDGSFARTSLAHDHLEQLPPLQSSEEVTSHFLSTHLKIDFSKQTKTRITSEVERIVFRIWTTVGDIIMPGHPFDTSGVTTIGKKPPLAQETLSHLQQLSTLSNVPQSPSESSVSTLTTTAPSHPTFQQILTAYLLHSLLLSPSHSLPLNKVKEMLSDKACTTGSPVDSAGQSTTRILYGCVAKRLIRIDRGGGEQVVKFDI
ncbi:hypothetical protein BDQ12DRAFT_708501 [Crucibulum laeve]|uniref:Uncharacterized protein n=1 Tax=Crucibulum laeve TaxID=68775 RepID=A0A5C3MJP7_9AGAR|nr:hypothetical protein BDQ12DRAFT_708501 [Crucibulum laeve]